MYNRATLLKSLHSAIRAQAQADAQGDSRAATAAYSEQVAVQLMLAGQKAGNDEERARRQGKGPAIEGTPSFPLTRDIQALIKHEGLSYAVGWAYAALPFTEARFFIRSAWLGMKTPA